MKTLTATHLLWAGAHTSVTLWVLALVLPCSRVGFPPVCCLLDMTSWLTATHLLLGWCSPAQAPGGMCPYEYLTVCNFVPAFATLACACVLVVCPFA